MYKLFALLIGVLIITSFTKEENPSDKKPLNVLFIVADDLSNMLGCYGEEKIITPNIDKLASESRVFDRAYCQASLCCPSRTSFLTGYRPNQTRILTNSPHFRGIFPKMETLPQHFKNNGYHTVGIGKIFHNWGHIIEGDPSSWSEKETFHYAAHYQDTYIPGKPYQLHTDIKKGPAVERYDVSDEAYLDGRIAGAAVEKIKMLKETPFFLAVGFWKPHLPYNAPAKYWDMYDEDNLIDLRYEEFVSEKPELGYIDSKEARSYSDVPKNGPISPAKKKELRHGYMAAVTYFDAQVGKVIDQLEESGLRDNTIIVLLSDHGYHAGEHGHFGKWTQYEIGTRVPLLISVPEMHNPGGRTNNITELIDLFPTLTELCGISDDKIKNDLAGTSLVPVLKDPKLSIKSAAVSQISRPSNGGPSFTILGSTIRTENFRYTTWNDRNTGEVLHEELYDLTDDILKVDNVINEEKYSKTKKALEADLNAILLKDMDKAGR